MTTDTLDTRVRLTIKTTLTKTTTTKNGGISEGTRHEKPISIPCSSTDIQTVATWIFQLVEGDIQEFVRERIEDVAENPDEYEGWRIGRDETAVSFREYPPTALYLAAVRAADNSRSRDVVGVLLDWVQNGGGDFAPREFQYRCRRVVRVLAADQVEEDQDGEEAGDDGRRIPSGVATAYP